MNAVVSVAPLAREPYVHVHHVLEVILAADHAVVVHENRVLLVVIGVVHILKLLQVEVVQEVEREEEGKHWFKQLSFD